MAKRVIRMTGRVGRLAPPVDEDYWAETSGLPETRTEFVLPHHSNDEVTETNAETQQAASCYFTNDGTCSLGCGTECVMPGLLEAIRHCPDTYERMCFRVVVRAEMENWPLDRIDQELSACADRIIDYLSKNLDQARHRIKELQAKAS